MKRVVVVGVLVLAGAGLVSAIGFSVGARGGFGIGVGQTTAGQDVQVDSLGNFTQLSPIFYSNGYGIKAMVGPEVILLDNLSIELLGGYLFGLEQQVAYFKDMGTDETDEVTATTSFIPVSLTVKLRLPLNRLVLYGGAGPSFGFLAKSKGVDEYNDGAGNLERTEYERTYGIGYGYHGVLGVNYSLTKSFLLVVEVRGEQLTFRVKKDKVTAYTVNGADQLMAAYPDVADRETEYVNDLSDYLNSPPGPDQPSQDLAFNAFANTISAYVGVVIRLF